VIAHLCNRLEVMQGGEKVEQFSVEDLRAGRVAHTYMRELRELSISPEEA
jgi:peptide/nickel transport system ATP-binding protein